MRFIQKQSYGCADFLMRKLQENHEKRRVYYFGFQIAIGSIIKGALLVGISLALGTLYPTLVAMLVFGALRTAAGGYHMSTYGKCIATSLGLFILSGIISQYTHQLWNMFSIITFTFLVLSTSLMVFIKWAPADTPHKPINKPEQIEKYKRRSVIYIIIVAVISCVLLYLNLKLYVIAICFGTLLEVFSVTPAGYRFFEKVSGQVDSIKKIKPKEKEC